MREVLHFSSTSLLYPLVATACRAFGISQTVRKVQNAGLEEVWTGALKR